MVGPSPDIKPIHRITVNKVIPINEVGVSVHGNNLCSDSSFEGVTNNETAACAVTTKRNLRWVRVVPSQHCAHLGVVCTVKHVVGNHTMMPALPHPKPPPARLASDGP